MAFVARLSCDDRGAERHVANVDATIRNVDRTPHDVVVEDLSATGFRVATAARLAVGAPITIGMAGIGMRAASVVRTDDGWYGCMFDAPLGSDEIARVFASTANVPIPFATTASSVFGDATIEPPIAKYPASMRLAMLGTLSVACWAIAIATVVALR